MYVARLVWLVEVGTVYWRESLTSPILNLKIKSVEYFLFSLKRAEQ